MKISGDQSLFSWGLGLPHTAESLGECLARSPRQFVNCGRVSTPSRAALSPFAITNIGLHIELPICLHEGSRIAFAIIDCSYQGSKLAIPLRDIEKAETFWVAERYCPAVIIADEIVATAKPRVLYIRSRDRYGPSLTVAPLGIGLTALEYMGWSVEEVWPPYTILNTDTTRLSSWFPLFYIKFLSKAGKNFVVKIDSSESITAGAAGSYTTKHITRFTRLTGTAARSASLKKVYESPSELHTMIFGGYFDNDKIWTDTLMAGDFQIVAETIRFVDRNCFIFSCRPY
jgi:hypothetical protein